MSDDLSSFFAKKKDKKKKNVVKLDEVGNMLEKKAKKQEERDRVESEDMKDGVEDRSPEESEWLDYESNTNNKVEGLRIKDMAIEEVEEEVKVKEAEEKEAKKEVTKTWGTVEKKESAPEIIPTADDYAASKPTRYVPPSQRWGAGAGGVSGPAPKIDVNNQEMFPTFAAAEQIEKHKKDEQKTVWTTAGPKRDEAPSRPGAYVPPRTSEPSAWGGGGPSAGSSNRERNDAMAAIRAMSATSNPSNVTPIKPPPPSEPELKKTANAYVPPHLRNKQ